MVYTYRESETACISLGSHLPSNIEAVNISTRVASKKRKTGRQWRSWKYSVSEVVDRSQAHRSYMPSLLLTQKLLVVVSNGNLLGSQPL